MKWINNCGVVIVVIVGVPGDFLRRTLARIFGRYDRLTTEKIGAKM